MINLEIPFIEMAPVVATFAFIFFKNLMFESNNTIDVEENNEPEVMSYEETSEFSLNIIENVDKLISMNKNSSTIESGPIFFDELQKNPAYQDELLDKFSFLDTLLTCQGQFQDIMLFKLDEFQKILTQT